MSHSWAVLAVSVSLLLSVSHSAPNLHRHLSPHQLFHLFQVHSHNEVPEYEVTTVRPVRVKRSSDHDDTRHFNVKAFGKRLHLRLTRNGEFEGRLRSLAVLEAATGPSGNLTYTQAPLNSEEQEEDVGTSYHDLDQMAALLVRHGDNGRIQMEGTIGNDLVIRPLPDTILNQLADDDEAFLDEDDNKITQEPKYGDHIIFRRKLGSIDELSDFIPMEDGEVTNGSLHRRHKREAPDTVWPEVLLIVDYDTYRLHGSNSRDVKRYYISFFNGVDLRYKLLSYPRVRVSLAGMIVAKDRDATPYLERNRLRPPNADAVDAAGALTDLGKYLYREDRLPTYDLAVTVTKLDMCRRRFEGGRCNRGTAGFAYVGGACVVNKRLEKVNSVAIIEDSGGFSGIIVAAHEIGHLLGCVHDGSPPPSYLGGPGATHCPWEDGFIMSDLRHTERGFRWSTCSVEQFKHFLNGETASCLYNYPHENELLARILPGNVLSLDDQCQRDRGTNACFKDARVCAQLFCFDSASGYCVSYRPAAEGSACGDGQACSNGRCLAEIENIIPDYTHVSHTYVRRPSPAERRMDGPPPRRRTRRSLASNDSCQDKIGCQDLEADSICHSRVYQERCCLSYRQLCTPKTPTTAALH